MMQTRDGLKVVLLIAFISLFFALVTYSLSCQLDRIEAKQQEIIKNQIELIENQAAMFQDSFHSNE